MNIKANTRRLISSVFARATAFVTLWPLAIALSLTNTAHAQLILNPTTNSYSSYFGTRSPEHLVDGSGCTVGPSGVLGAADTTVDSDVDGAMWYSNPFLTPPDTTPWVIFDFGGHYDVQTTRIWQFNQPSGFQVYGAADIVLSYSSDGSTFTSLPDIYPNEAGGTNGEPAQDFSTPVTGVRYVKLQILNTFGGPAASGLSEVRFVVNSNTAPPIITSQPTNQVIANGGTATFNVTGVSPTPISYQWQFNGTNLTNGVSISGATSSNLVVSAGVASQGNYDVVLSNLNGPVQSATVSLVLGSPIITRQPQNSVTPAGQTASFTVAATDYSGNSSNLSYQWLMITANSTNTLVNGGHISGATSTNLLLSNVTTNDNGQYRVLVTDTAIGKVTSSANAALLVAPIPTIGITFVSNSIFIGNIASYSSFYGPRSPTNLVDGADLTNGPSGIFGAADTVAGGDPNSMWYSNPFLSPPDTQPWVVFDFGGLYNVQTTRIWNYNSDEAGGVFTVYGAADVIESSSTDGTNFTQVAEFFPAQAPGTNSEPAQDFSTPVTGVRYVKLQIMVTFGGAQATGFSGVRFVAGGSNANLLETQISLKNGVAGLHYQIQSSTSLSPANWQLVQDIPSLGAAGSVTDPIPVPASSQRFYRAVLFP